jgi:hypothetical protein
MSIPSRNLEFLALLKKIMRNPETQPFLEPVNWESLGLHDYPQIIKRPMDLGTVKKRLELGRYKTVEDAADDVRQVWKNCMLYNSEDSGFYILAQNWADTFEEDYTALMAVVPKEKDPDLAPTFDERSEMARLIGKLGTAHRGRFISYLEDNFPYAVRMCPYDADAIVNLDTFDKAGFLEVLEYIKKLFKLRVKIKEVKEEEEEVKDK